MFNRLEISNCQIPKKSMHTQHNFLEYLIVNVLSRIQAPLSSGHTQYVELVLFV